MHFLSKTISFVTSPFFCFIYVFCILVAKYGLTNEVVDGSLLLVIHGNILPLIFVLIMLKLGKISDLHIKNREERHSFYGFMGLSTILCGIELWWFSFNLVLRLWLTFFLALVVIGLVNLRWKISAHLATTAALATAMGLLLGQWFYLLGLILVILVSWSRWYLKHHDLYQILAGTLVGILAVFTAYNL